MRYLSCSLPWELVLQDACEATAALYLPQVPPRAPGATRAASWHGCPQGKPKFQGCLFLTWPVLVSHGRARTLQNPARLAPSPKPAQDQAAAPSAAGSPMEAPSLEEPDPRFFPYLGYSLRPYQLKEQGLAITESKQRSDFEGHGPSLHVLGSCSKLESHSTWSTRRWGGTFHLFLWLVLSPCVASGNKVTAEEALAL